ncbi:hypothetical protein ACROYT_G003625 [Oculina patagonica]
MYWCEVGNKPKIEVANMDGDKRRMLVRRGLHNPNGLTLDDTKNRLYWVDSSLDTLEYYDLERHTITTLLDRSSILSHPFGLTSLDDQLYWTDSNRYAVYQADKTTASNPKVLVRGLRSPMDIHAYDRNETLPDHPCSSSYGGCTHLCLLRPDGYNCSCPDHLQSGEVCSPSSKFISTREPPTSAGTNACLPNTCKNGGTCVIPGNYCKCEKFFTWHDCSVYVGSSTVEIELAASKENQWNLLDFKIAMATACTEFFCKTGECTSMSKSGRVKRSVGTKFFQPSDIVISGISSGGWKVQFAVLFPSVDGKAPKPMSPVEIIHMVNVNKGSIEKAVGGKIKRITAGHTVRPIPMSTQDKGISTVAAAAVGGIVVLVIIVVVYVICRMRRKRTPDERRTATMRLGNNVTGDTHMNTEFVNPTFDADSICDSISRARGISVAASLEQASNGALKENDTRNEITNKAPSDDRTYQALDETAMTCQTYTVACS